MARKEPAEPRAPHGRRDVVGIILLSLALLLFAALLTYDRHDHNVAPANIPPHNWAGRIGAWMANDLFLLLGAGAYLFPTLIFCFALNCFLPSLIQLKRRWIWILALTLTCLCALDLATDRAGLKLLLANPASTQAGFLEHITYEINAPSAGGTLGELLNRYVFSYFGDVGSWIVFAALYLISIYGLTNFHLGAWVREWWQARQAAREEAPLDEKGLEKRTRELEKEAKKLEKQLEKAAREGDKNQAGVAASGKPADPDQPELGPDLQPVPEPTVRDLSQPQVKPLAEKEKGKGKKGEPALIMATGDEDELAKPVSPRNLGPASTADVLGRPAEEEGKGAAEADSAKEGEEDEPLPVVAPTKPKFAPKKPKPLAVATPPLIGNYQLPSFDLLGLPDPVVKPTESKEELLANARLMQQTLAQFDIDVALGDITKGPTITRYELHPAPGVKLEKISNLTNNIAAALKAERINVLAPIPGKSSVGIEVPNLIKSKVIMRELLESEEWRNSKARIPLALGKDVYGHPIVADLAEMPHLLIAGSTGSGKSVCINAVVASLLYRFSPDQLRFVMIDPKVVELQQYNALPHLVVPVVTDPKKVILALRWVVNEMEKRYQIFARVGVRNIKSFNDRPKDKPLPQREPEVPHATKKEKGEGGVDGFAVEVDEEIVVPREDDIVIPEKLSYIVVIIDELADLMLVAPADVEMAIARITQMARAAGIHCIVATQRPSVDVITGVIKANIPCRIAFQVAAKVDSRTILDAMGADKLLGKGDMLYLPPGTAKLIRAQGALITDQEIQSIVDFIARQAKPSYEMDIHQQLSKTPSSFEESEGGEEDEDLIQQCIEVIRSEQKASVSLMQRRLRLGYTRAARIMDQLEERGIVGPSKGAEPRDILIDLDAGSEPRN